MSKMRTGNNFFSTRTHLGRQSLWIDAEKFKEYRDPQSPRRHVPLPPSPNRTSELAEAVAKRQRETMDRIAGVDPALNAGYDAPPPLPDAAPAEEQRGLVGMEQFTDAGVPPPLAANHVPLERVSAAREAAACGHARAGEDLCHLCHSRARRNIPVYFDEERKRKDREEDRVLQQYQRVQEEKALEAEIKRNVEIRDEQRNMAEFNKSIAEQLKQQNSIKETSTHPSYIFDLRPLTPPRYVAQDKYHRDLYSQVDSKARKHYKEKEDREEAERREQQQLAEDLAKEREAFLTAKKTIQQQYKQALTAQVINKPAEVPKSVPDATEPIFGIADNTVEKVEKRKVANREIAAHQTATDGEKKRQELNAKLDRQREEAESLAKIKAELLEDRSTRFQRVVDNRKSLEEDWFSSHAAKLRREADDRARFRAPCNLVHEQTDKYKRCDQCERHLNNGGESNIWRDTRYVPGSRIMI